MYTARFFDDDPNGDPSEFESIRADIPSEIPWCSAAFGTLYFLYIAMYFSIPLADKSPDAVNLWMGDSSSITSIHSGEYIVFAPRRPQTIFASRSV